MINWGGDRNLMERIEKSTVSGGTQSLSRDRHMLGTGLGSLGDYIDKVSVIDYGDIPEFRYLLCSTRRKVNTGAS